MHRLFIFKNYVQKCRQFDIWYIVDISNEGEC